ARSLRRSMMLLAAMGNDATKRLYVQKNISSVIPSRRSAARDLTVAIYASSFPEDRYWQLRGLKAPPRPLRGLRCGSPSCGGIEMTKSQKARRL
ncbi:MAG: hypothetical protein ABIR38_03875, partial [Chthoniobacterales bacterium]